MVFNKNINNTDIDELKTIISIPQTKHLKTDNFNRDHQKPTKNKLFKVLFKY